MGDEKAIQLHGISFLSGVSPRLVFADEVDCEIVNKPTSERGSALRKSS